MEVFLLKVWRKNKGNFNARKLEEVVDLIKDSLKFRNKE